MATAGGILEHRFELHVLTATYNLAYLSVSYVDDILSSHSIIQTYRSLVFVVCQPLLMPVRVQNHDIVVILARLELI